MRKNLVKFIIEEVLPFRFAESTRFTDFMHTFLQSQYSNVSRKTIYRESDSQYVVDIQKLK